MRLSELVWKDRYSYEKNIPFTEKDLQCLGTKFQIVKFKPDTEIRPHYHKKTCEIFYIQSGNGILRLNGEEFRCQADDFYLCKPETMHEFVNDTDKDFVILVFKTNEVENDIYWG